MTPMQAESILRGKLTFGDERHIAAVRTISIYETAMEMQDRILSQKKPVAVQCPACDGRGRYDCASCRGVGDCPRCGHFCDDCDGLGTVLCERCLGVRLFVIDEYRRLPLREMHDDELAEIIDRLGALVAGESDG